jgi:RNA polymerase sigma-70 factor (ECF subfamily)
MERIHTRQARFASSESQLRTTLIQGLGGDAGAYHDFLKVLTGHLRAYFRRRLFQRPDDVEDLVQETLLAVHNKRHTYDPDQPLTAWIHAIARYKFIDLLRAHSAREDLNDPLEDELLLFSEMTHDAFEAKKDVEKLLMQLPERQRLPIVYVKLEGLSVAETANRTGMSESAIKVGIHRGLKVLAEKMRGQT